MTSRNHMHYEKQRLSIVYEFIASYIEEIGYAPTMREIADGTNFGRSTIDKYLSILAAQGKIRRDLGVARGISLVKDR